MCGRRRRRRRRRRDRPSGASFAVVGSAAGRGPPPAFSLTHYSAVPQRRAPAAVASAGEDESSRGHSGFFLSSEGPMSRWVRY